MMTIFSVNLCRRRYEFLLTYKRVVEAEFTCCVLQIFFFIVQVMKYMLYTAVEESPSREFIDPDLLNRYFIKFNEKFFAYCSTELEKINSFYAGKG